MLGRAAPRRVLHELGLRTGITGRRFELASQRAVRDPRPVEVPPLGPPTAVPAAAARRAREQAGTLLAGTVEVFGRPLPLDLEHGPVGDWHRDPVTEVRWPSDVPWWRIDVRGADRPADVKWTWEAARHRHLVSLARAAHLDPDDGRSAGALAAGLRGWSAAVPLERSVHWLSNLEIAVRSLAWLQCLALAPHALDARTRRGVEVELRVAATHLRLDLRRTRTSMANNHLVGDLVGLVALQRSFGADASATDRALVAQVEQEVRADGSMIEESLSYHRFVLDLLAARVLVGGAPSPIGEALVRGSQWLVRLGAFEGPLPQHGDWDEGRALVAAGSPHDVRGTARLGLALGGSGAAPAWRDEHDEVAWHVAEGEPVPPDEVEAGGHDLGGGVARVRVGAWTTWLRASGGGWHGHADHTGVVVHHDDRTVVGDPGTGAYNGRDDERQHLRSSVAHDVLRLDGEDQLGPHRQFRWQRRAGGVVGPPIRHRDGIAAWAAHDAYLGTTPGRRVVRVAWTTPRGVVVADWVHPAAGRWSLSIPLHPDVDHHEGRLVRAGSPDLVLHAPPATEHRGEDGPLDGWWSPTYGTRVPATRLALDGGLDGRPVVWAVCLEGTAAPETSDDGSVLVDGTVLRVRAGDDGALLEVGDDRGPSTAAALRWP